jgi:hypothetical protein
MEGDLVSVKPRLSHQRTGIGHGNDNFSADFIMTGIPENDPFKYDKECEGSGNDDPQASR